VTLIRSRLFGRRMVSPGFGAYGGPLADNPAAANALDRAAVDLARQRGAGHLEYRLRQPRHPDWPKRDDLHATFRKTLDPDPDANFSAIRRKQRAEVRRGLNRGLTDTVEPDIARFYPIYAQSVRNLGTPVFARAYLRALKEVFAETCEVRLIHDPEHGPIAGVMSFYFRDEVLPYYGGGRPVARQVAGNDFMYWALMRAACQAGCGVFDFGRSRVASGAYRFKKHWGFEPQPLVYEYQLLGDRTLPDTNPANPKYRWAIWAWKRLPLGVANTLGPPIARALG
jgi:FemAB-related protein (PEP-CTERM system-associated)